MSSISSKVMFGIGVALAVAAISSIFVTMVATQAQSNSGSQSQGSQQGGTASSGGNSQQGGGAAAGGQQQGSQSGGSMITIPKGAASQQVDKFYQPDPAQVSPNSKVTWQNKDSAPHTATADDDSFDTGNIAPGQSGSATVKGQGQIAYHCTIHPFMKAMLQVAAGGSQQGGAQQQSQQQTSQNQSQSTQTAASGSQASGGNTQALQQAGQALIQAGNALEQASGGTSTAQQSSGQSQAAQGQQQSSAQGGQQSGGTTSTAQAPQQSQQQSSQGQQGAASGNASQQASGQQTQQSGSTQSASPQSSGGSLTQALQSVAQLLSQAASNLQQAVSGGNSTGQSQQSQQGSAATQQSSSQQGGAAGGSQQTQSQQQQSQSGQQGQQPSQGSNQQQGGSSQQTQTAGQQGGAQSQQSGGMTNQIDIPQGAQQGPQYYSPANAQVSPGSKVTWNNKDSVAHTATAQDGSFDTGNIAPGSSGSATIQGQGQISYYCTIHPWMTASLTVGGGGSGAQQQAGQQSSQQGPQSSGQQQGQTSAAGQNGASQQQGGAQSQQGAGQQQGGGQTSAEGFPIRTYATAYEVLPKSTDTDTGLEPEHKDDWINPNHDIHYTRTSQQTTISKDNVDQLQVKWILNSDFPIENPPLIIGDRGYAQDNAMRVIAFDADTGLNLWKFDPGVADKQNQQLPRGVFSHGITYDQGVIFAPTGANGTIVALNATDGDLIWQSASIGDPRLGYRLPMPPIVWKDYVIAGSALGDEPPFAPAAKGSITAFNRTNGEKIWNISTVTGAWIEGENAKKNGGATIWSGGSFDPDTGVMYLPTGNAAPDFNATSRPPPNPYTSSIIAVDIKTGRILWDTVSVSATDEHDWDTAWGTSLATVKTDSGDTMKVVIAQNKRGEGFALDTQDGSVLWNKTIGVEFRTGAQPTPYGSGEVWPGANYGIEDYNANDNETAYFAASNMGFNYFTNAQGTSGHLEPVFDAIENGIGNGSITAVDIATGKIKWEHPTEFPTWVSPAVTNGVVFSGHITATGKPYEFNDFGAVTESPLLPSGVIIALDKDTGKKLWEFNVGAPVGIGGPSIGNGMLYVTTGSPAEVGSNKGGYIVAFGLPDDASNQTITSSVPPSTHNATSTDNATQQNSDAKSHQPAAPETRKQKVG